MKKLISTSVIFFFCFLLMAPSSYCQNNKQTNGTRDNMDDEDVPVNSNQGRDGRPHRQSNAGEAVSRVAFGIEGGVNLAVLDIDNGNSSISAGGTVGALVDIRMFGWFYIQPGLFYVMNGGSNILSTIDYSTNDININTIEIPVNIICKFGRPGRTRFFIGAGPYYGKNINGSVSNGQSLKIGSDYNSDIKSTDIGIAIGIGLELKNGLFFRIREQKGLSNLQPNYGSSVYTASDAVTIGFLFGKHAKPKRAGSPDDNYLQRKL